MVVTVGVFVDRIADSVVGIGRLTGVTVGRLLLRVRRVLGEARLVLSVARLLSSTR